jgi:hypothetical protein
LRVPFDSSNNSELLFIEEGHRDLCLWQTGNWGVYRPALKPAQSAACSHGGEGGYERPSEQSVYLTAKKLV